MWDPVTQTWQPMPLTAAEAEAFWQDQYVSLLTHASQPLIHWPWHDYGPTTSADPVTGDGYTVAMYENTIAMAAQDDAEFATLADAAARITTFQSAQMAVEHASESVVSVTVNTPNVGTFALRLNTEPGTVVYSVDNWYAYHDNQVFLDEDGGTFVVRLEGSEAPVSRITALPMRAHLMSLSGDGTQLSFILEGEGQVKVMLSGDPSNFTITGADSVTPLGGNGVGINFDHLGMHTVNVSFNGTPPVAGDDIVTTNRNKPVTIAAGDLLVNDTDADGDMLSITSMVTTSTKGGVIIKNTDGTYTYTPPVGFSGIDSLIYTISDGKGGSATANVSITVLDGAPPVAADQSVETNADTPVAITLTGSDADNDPLTFSVVTQPTQGTLSGTAPNLTYTPNPGFSGADSFTFTVNDGTADSNIATVNITVMAIASGDTIGLYDPLASAFYLKHSNTGGKADMVYGYGPAGADWLPVMGDWNNDGKDTAGLYDQRTGTFYLKNTHSGGKADNRFRYGPANAAWQPLIGDWNSDGTDTVGLYDPASGTFYLKDDHSGGTATYRFRFGPVDPVLIPLAGDWNGDGQDTVGLYHPRTGVFYLINAYRSGKADLSFRYGPANAGWQPVVGDWNGNGTDAIGLYRPDTSQFYLRHTNTSGAADLSFRYGPAGQSWQPLVGKWQ